MASSPSSQQSCSIEKFFQTKFIDLGFKSVSKKLSFQSEGNEFYVSGNLSAKEWSAFNLAKSTFKQSFPNSKLKWKLKLEEESKSKIVNLSVRDKDLTEFSETEVEFQAKVKYIASLFKKGEVVIHTGAGISTSCNIPDFRGPNGVWTSRDRGKPAPKSIPLDQAVPSYAHRVIQYMIANKHIDYLVSQNVDGLHLRSGVPADKLSELHGNCFKESCVDCGKEYNRCFAVKNRKGPFFKQTVDERSQSGISHITGRKCDCGGMLRDTIIHFQENLPEEDLEKAMEHSQRAYLNLTLGTSLHVTPAADIPPTGQILAVVNLQKTGRDVEALKSGGVIINSKIDEFMEALVKELNLDFPGNTMKEKKKYEAEFLEKVAEEALQEEVKEAQAQAEAKAKATSAKAKAAAKSGCNNSNLQNPHTGLNQFFFDLGLPSSMAQLPDYLDVTYWTAQDTLTVYCPKDYPVNIGDFVETVQVYYRTKAGAETGNKSAKNVETGPKKDKNNKTADLEIKGKENTQSNDPEWTFLMSADQPPFAFGGIPSDAASLQVVIELQASLGPVAQAPIKTSLQLDSGKINDKAKAMEFQVKMPKLKLSSGFANHITGHHVLKPTVTRVRRADGSTYTERVSEFK